MQSFSAKKKEYADSLKLLMTSHTNTHCFFFSQGLVLKVCSCTLKPKKKMSMLIRHILSPDPKIQALSTLRMVEDILFRPAELRFYDVSSHHINKNTVWKTKSLLVLVVHWSESWNLKLGIQGGDGLNPYWGGFTLFNNVK